MPARPIDETHDPARRSWVDCGPGCEFPIQHLPLDTFRRTGDEMTLTGVCRRQGAATIGFGRCTGIIAA